MVRFQSMLGRLGIGWCRDRSSAPRAALSGLLGARLLDVVDGAERAVHLGHLASERRLALLSEAALAAVARHLIFDPLAEDEPPALVSIEIQRPGRLRDRLRLGRIR